jgi:hypothetical protein
MESHAGTRPVAPGRLRALGGTAGNELLTMSIATVLTVLLAGEGITLLDLGQLLSVHMFIGLVLIPPVLVKLASTGYRFARYYTRSPAYLEKGPPPLPMRLLAPVLVVTTVGIFITGVALLAFGHHSNTLLFLHKGFFIAWAFAFGVHFLVYSQRILVSLSEYRRSGRRRRIPGAGLRGTLVAASLGVGLALAISLTSAIAGWHGGGPH